MPPASRRTCLSGCGALAIVLLAGCVSNSGAGSTVPEGTDVQASFFVTADFASHVAGGAASVDTLVPFGQHGHGWEPGPDVQRSVLGSDVFVYVGEGFQPWADDLVRSVREDAADVVLIEAGADVELLGADGDEEDDRHVPEEQGEDGHDGDAHGHGATDPHFWLDLDRAARAVDTIARGLAEADPENADAYAGNAEDYTGRLSSLDRAFADALAERERDTVLVAGHNSYRYLARRYGFHVEALAGLSPDATPTPQDVRRAQDAIAEHDVEHVLAPVFESDRAATQLVAETNARAVLPLTPVPSLTEEWAEAGWGFIDVMENVNLPSLRTALGA